MRIEGMLALCAQIVSAGSFICLCVHFMCSVFVAQRYCSRAAFLNAVACSRLLGWPVKFHLIYSLGSAPSQMTFPSGSAIFISHAQGLFVGGCRILARDS
jgi:hypothetical protein